MLEEAPCIARRNRVEGPTHRFQQRFSGARPGPAHQRLELGERLFYGVEVRGVGRQIHKSSQPLPSISSLTRGPLWEERLSITTICPGSSAGARTRSR